MLMQVFLYGACPIGITVWGLPLGLVPLRITVWGLPLGFFPLRLLYGACPWDLSL